MCLACCPHGALCTLPPGHPPPHAAVGSDGEVDCTWSEEESISRAEADRRVIAAGGGWEVAAGAAFELEVVAELLRRLDGDA
jgi:hypothetical protein